MGLGPTIDRRTLLLSSLAAGLAGTGTAWAQTPRDGGHDLVVAVTSLPPHLDPMGSNSNDNERVSQNLVENLIFYDFKARKMKPGLATAWRMLDDTTMELDIRQGVKCHDGSDFTAEDVEFMFGPARYGAPNAPGYPTARSFLATIASVKATDRFKVQITTTKPDPLLDQRLASWMGQVPGAAAFRRAESWEKWGQSVVGTGPYRIADLRPGQYMRFEAFDGYWGGPPPVRSFTLRLVQEVGARVAGLRTGEFDIITEIAPDQFGPIGNDPNGEIVGGPIRSIRALIYNSKHPVLKEVRVRRALNLAIDRQLIVDSLFAGRTTIPNGLQMDVFGDMYIAEHKATGYDPAAARALLAEAGYSGGEIAYRYWKDYYTAEIATAQVLQQMWKAVGLNVKLEMVETTDQALAEGQGITDISNGAYYFDQLGQLFRLYGTGGLIPNRGQWSNRDFDHLGEVLLGVDHEKRRAAAARMLDIYEEDPPGTYLHTLPMFYGKRKQIAWTPTDTAFMDFRPGNLGIG
jgi:peptide/nickel transport system substrate-binding protein